MPGTIWTFVQQPFFLLTAKVGVRLAPAQMTYYRRAAGMIRAQPTAKEADTLEKLTALKGMPFPAGGMSGADMEAELKRMKTFHPDEQTAGAEGAAEQAAAKPGSGDAAGGQDVVDVHTGAAPGGAHPLDEPQVVSAEQVAHMKPWDPATLKKAPATSGSALPPTAPGEDKPKVVSQSDLPHKTPWSTLASQEADQLAHQAELDAAQAEIDARSKLGLFEKENTAADKVAADEAAKEAKELELRAKVAEEIAEEQAQWAVEQGELRTANNILATDPQLWQTDEDMTLPKG